MRGEQSDERTYAQRCHQDVGRRSRSQSGAAGGDALAYQERPQRFAPEQLVDSGHRFFGTVSRGLAQVVEEATRRWGQPNAYVLGQEASGAFVAGARFGEGTMYTRNAGDQRIYGKVPRSVSTPARMARGP